MTAALHPAEPALATDRVRRGGRAGKRAGGAAAFEQPPFRQLKNPVRADQADLRRRAGIDPPRVAARAEGDRRRRAARRRAPDHEGARRRRARGHRARALRRRHDPGTDQSTAPAEFTLHARNPAHNVRFGGNNLIFSQMASAPNCSDLDNGRRPGNQADFRNFLKLAQMHNILMTTGGYPVEPVDIHPSIRHLECIRDLVDPDRQGVPHLFARQGAQCRRHRDRPHRARHFARAAAGRAVGLHDHQHQLAAEARHPDDGRHHPDVRQRPAGHRDAVHAGGRHGAGDGGGRAGAAECRGAGRHRLHADGEEGRAGRLWRLHLQCRHEVRRAGLRHAGIHEGADRRRPARAALRHPLPHLECLRRQHGRRAGRL